MRRSSSALLLLAAGALASLTATPRAAADCALVAWVPVLATRQPVPAGGALLLGMSNTRQLPDSWYRAGVNTLSGRWPSVSLRRGGTTIALRVESLAPGLARAVPAQPPSPGRWTLVGLPNESEVEFIAAPLPAAPVAPVGVRLRHAQRPANPREFDGHSTMHLVQAELTAPPPANAAAMVAYWDRAASPQTAGRFGGPVTSIPLYEPPGRCSTELPGRSPPGASERARVAWVDAFGRISPPSTELTMETFSPANF